MSAVTGQLTSTPTFFHCLFDKQAGSKLSALNAKARSLEGTGGTLYVDSLALTFLSNCWVVIRLRGGSNCGWKDCDDCNCASTERFSSESCSVRCWKSVFSSSAPISNSPLDISTSRGNTAWFDASILIDYPSREEDLDSMCIRDESADSSCVLWYESDRGGKRPELSRGRWFPALTRDTKLTGRLTGCEGNYESGFGEAHTKSGFGDDDTRWPYCCCALSSGSCQTSKRSDSVGGFLRSTYSVLLRFLRSRSQETSDNVVFEETASNNVLSSGEQSIRCSGTALIKDPPWTNHTTITTCDSISVHWSTVNTLAGLRRTIFPSRQRSRPSPIPPLLLRTYLTNCPTFGFLSTRDLAYWTIRKVFRASTQTKTVWLAVWNCSRRSKLDRSSPSPSSSISRAYSVPNTHCNGLYPSNVCTSHLDTHTVFNELFNRRLWNSILHQMQLILQKSDMSLNSSNLSISLVYCHLNFNVSRCTSLSKLMRFERIFRVQTNNSWCPCTTKPIHTDSFNVVHSCQVSELITFLENQSDMEPRSLIDDVHDNRFTSISNSPPVTRMNWNDVSKFLTTGNIHRSDSSCSSSHMIIAGGVFTSRRRRNSRPLLGCPRLTCTRLNMISTTCKSYSDWSSSWSSTGPSTYSSPNSSTAPSTDSSTDSSICSSSPTD